MKFKQAWLNWRKLIIDDRDLSTIAKAIGLYLNTYMNDSHDMAFPSIKRIRGEMNIGSNSTVIKYLNELAGKGYLQRQKRFSKTTIYHATIPEKITSITNPVVLHEMNHSITESVTPVLQDMEPNKQENKQINKQDNAGVKTSSKSSPCPYSEIVNLYHEKLPMCPRVVRLSDQRKRAVKARWGNGMATLDDWQAYFEDVAASRFLTGKVDPPRGRKQFIADFDFLIRESTIIKTQEGKYHDRVH